MSAIQSNVLRLQSSRAPRSLRAGCLSAGLAMWAVAAMPTAAAAPAMAAIPPTAPAAAGPTPGRYRVVLQSPGGDLPFGLDLERRGTAWIAYLVNGKERLKVTDVSVRGNAIEMKMPGYENRLTATAAGREWLGELVLDKQGGKDQHIPVRAELGPSYRFFPGAAGPVRAVPGRWAVTFTDDDGHAESAVGEFSQTRDIVSGTMLTDTGDHRFLAGQVRGDELYLSTFDGAHVFLYRAKIGADLSLAGDFWSGNAHHERWAAIRDAHAALPDAFSLTHMRAGEKTFDFTFPDLDGMAVSLDQLLAET